jgi:hypothetical protein
MAQYFILIKKKGSKRWVGAIPSRKDVPLTRLRSTVKNQIKKGFIYKIINQTQLKRMFSRVLAKKKKR